MKHPAEYYIRYLLAASWSNDEQDVDVNSTNHTLLGYELPEVSEDAFNRIRVSFQPPDTFRFRSKKEASTIEFMKEEKIYSLWHPDKDVKRVLQDMLDHHQLMHITQVLLMGDVPAEIIAEKVSKRFRVDPSITSRMIDIYRHYYWRVSSLGYKGWEKLLRTDPHQDRYMASLYGGPQQALYRVGFNPKYDYKAAMRDTHRQISFRIKHLASKPDDKNIIDLLVKLSREERALFDKLYGEGGGLEEQIRELRRFMMETRNPDVKTLKELVDKLKGGSHSGDGEPPSAEPSEED